MNIIIRQADKNDVAKILEILNYEIINTTVVYDYQKRTYEEQLRWFKKKKEENLPVIVAVVDGKVAAYGTYGIFRPWEAYKFSIEHSLYVEKNKRKLGIGKLILQELIDIARLEGYHTIVAGIDASNQNSIIFHKQFGFKEVGNLKQIGYKFNKWLDLTFMQLFLK